MATTGRGRAAKKMPGGARKRPQDSGDEVERLVGAARKLLQSGDGSDFKLNVILNEAGLGTRAFYRHFASKDELALAVFATEAEREARRIERRIKDSRNPIEGVVAWIDARLELGFNQKLASSLRPLTEAATNASHQFPRQLEQIYNRELEPLVAQLASGVADGSYRNVEPVLGAKAIYHVVSGVVEERWAGISLPRRETREGVVRFCLSGLGVDHSRTNALLRARATSS
jgi:AcrR family transcriptional regulator